MSQFDASSPQHTPFNWLFWLANGLVVLVVSGLLYAVIYVDEEFAAVESDHDQFAASVHHYLQYQQLQCESNSYSSDVLLRKINNSTEPLPNTYVPENLVPVPSTYLHPRIGNQLVRQEVLDPLVQMLTAARAEDIDLRLNSAYRSHARQQEVYERNTDADFITKPERAARAGYSEHQLGAAVDVSQYPNNGQRGYDWLQEHAYEYGFVLSYPDGAQDVTEFLFEPWHWRYVGKPIAQHIHDNNMLFNHEKTLLLPSPVNDNQELPYEYAGRDLWVWKYIDRVTEIELLIQGQQESEFFSDLVPLMQSFEQGRSTIPSGGLELPTRNWIVNVNATSYIDRDGEEWIRTSFASPQSNEIERLEVLYRPGVGYLLISYQTQDAGERFVREFTSSCGVN